MLIGRGAGHFTLCPGRSLSGRKPVLQLTDALFLRLLDLTLNLWQLTCRVS